MQPDNFVLHVNIFPQLTCKHTDALILIRHKTVILLLNISSAYGPTFLGYVLLTSFETSKTPVHVS